MTNNDYIKAIATLICDFRKGEIEIPLDEKHVTRWVEQFNEEDQGVILEQVFHILSRSYFKEERIDNFLGCVTEYLNENFDLEDLSFVHTQEIGQSQNILMDKIASIFQQKYGKIIKENDYSSSVYVYVDDGLYTGKRLRKDLIYTIQNCIPKNSRLLVFFMIAYTNGVSYTKDELDKVACQKNISIEIIPGKIYENNRNCKVENFDIIWPSTEVLDDPKIKAFEKRLKATGKANYLYQTERNSGLIGLFTSTSSKKIVEKAFLSKGISISNKLETLTFLPLGFSNTYTYGFGSFVATDYNIPNNCPLVLWWGSLSENHSDTIGCWYPLLPRRSNDQLYATVIKKQEEMSLNKYRDVIYTVFHLAEKRKIKREKSPKKEMDIMDRLMAQQKEREECELLQYLKALDMEAIQVIQTVMYIGRDYPFPEMSDDEWEKVIEKCAENPDYEAEVKASNVINPNDVFFAWYEELCESGWKKKSIEINQIYEKGPLDTYLKKAIRILQL